MNMLKVYGLDGECVLSTACWLYINYLFLRYPSINLGRSLKEAGTSLATD